MEFALTLSQKNGNVQKFSRTKGMCIALVCFSLVWAHNLLGEPKPAPLSSGMRYHDVIKLWGAPKEKEDHEVGRQEVWIYKNGKVIFTEGKLTSWNSPAYDLEANAPIAAPVAEVPRVENEVVKNEQNPTVVEEILSEIMKEPSQPDSSDGKSSAPPQPGNIMVRPSEIVPPEPIN